MLYNSYSARSYAAPLYIDIKKTVITRQPTGEEEQEEEDYPKIFIGEVSLWMLGQANCTSLPSSVCFDAVSAECNQVILLHMQVPIMLRSDYCSLKDHSDKELTDLGECPYDQVGAGIGLEQDDNM
jgi:DNA-directed RNA polymerase II subunit RPB2